jgi:hypothetical protein
VSTLQRVPVVVKRPVVLVSREQPHATRRYSALASTQNVLVDPLDLLALSDPVRQALQGGAVQAPLRA